MYQSGIGSQLSVHGLSRIHTFLTCHFTHMSFLTYVLDSVIMYLFC